MYIGGDYYSAPHIHRHKKLRIKITENQVEIFLHLQCMAIHPRRRHKNGKRIFVDTHFPPASQAYYEATPQKLLSQSRFIHPELERRCRVHLTSGEFKIMSTAIAKNLMAEMKLLGMFAAYDQAVTPVSPH